MAGDFDKAQKTTQQFVNMGLSPNNRIFNIMLKYSKSTEYARSILKDMIKNEVTPTGCTLFHAAQKGYFFLATSSTFVNSLA